MDGKKYRVCSENYRFLKIAHPSRPGKLRWHLHRYSSGHQGLNLWIPDPHKVREVASAHFTKNSIEPDWSGTWKCGTNRFGSKANKWDDFICQQVGSMDGNSKAIDSLYLNRLQRLNQQAFIFVFLDDSEVPMLRRWARFLWHRFGDSRADSKNWFNGIASALASAKRIVQKAQAIVLQPSWNFQKSRVRSLIEYALIIYSSFLNSSDARTFRPSWPFAKSPQLKSILNSRLLLRLIYSLQSRRFPEAWLAHSNHKWST